MLMYNYVYKGSNSKELRERAKSARQIQRVTYKNMEQVNSNVEMTPALIKEFY